MNDKIKEAFGMVKEDISKIRIELAELKGIMIGLLKFQPVSQVSVSGSLNKSQNKIETKIINKIKRTKKKVVISEINKLFPLLSVIDIKNIIVDEKGLCSKASFYRYIDSLKSQVSVPNETKVRLN